MHNLCQVGIGYIDATYKEVRRCPAAKDLKFVDGIIKSSLLSEQMGEHFWLVSMLSNN